MSREDLGSIVGTSGAVIGRYERNEIANEIAQALEVSLDYLVGNNTMVFKDKKILERIETFATMPVKEQEQLFSVIYALIRDYKAKKTYS